MAEKLFSRGKFLRGLFATAGLALVSSFLPDNPGVVAASATHEPLIANQNSECCISQTEEYNPPVFTTSSGITRELPEPSPEALAKNPVISVEVFPSPTPSPIPSPSSTEKPKILAELPVQKEKEVIFSCNILTYHEFNKASFTREMLNLLTNGESVSVDRFWEVLNGRGDPAPKNSFMVTLDDSLKSQRGALDAVREIKAQTGKEISLTFFGIMGFPGHGDKTIEQLYNDEKTKNNPIFSDGTHNYLTIQDLLDILKEGHSIQNHTVRHPHLSQLSQEEMQNEVLYAEGRLDQLYALARKLYGPQIQRKVRVIASPFGQQAKREEDFFAKANFDLAFSTFASTTHTLSKRLHLGRNGKS